jgi:hypothetical protein
VVFKTEAGASRIVVIPVVGFMLLAGLGTGTGLVHAYQRSHPVTSGPVTDTGHRGSVSLAAATDTFLGTPHPDGPSAMAAWKDFAQAVVSANDAGDPAAVATTVDAHLAASIATPSGRAALAATESALNGQVLELPASARVAAAQRPNRSRRSDSTLHTPQLKVYYVNGVMTDLGEATTDAAMLGGILGVHVELAYDRSFLQVDDYAVELCMRGIVARYRDRAGIGDFGNTTLDQVITEADRNLQAAGDAALTVACKAADGVLSAANLARQKISDVVLSSSELVAQWMTGAQFASARVNVALVQKIEDDLRANDHVIMIGHSQGALFIRRALQDVNAWWPQAYATGQIAGCAAGTDPSLVPTPAPVAAEYISPAFWSDTTNSSDLNTGAQRYIALKGDILGNLKIAWVTPTVEPTRDQGSWIPGWNARELHRLTTYLQPGSPSRAQVDSAFGELRNALAGADAAAFCTAAKAPTATTPAADSTTAAATDGATANSTDGSGSGSGSTGGGATTSADPNDSLWVVWRAKDPFSGIGINVTTKTVFLANEVASGYSGGGMDPKATFQKEQMISSDYGSEKDAMTALCSQLTDVRMWPMGTGMHGVWQGQAYPLGDSVSCPSH